MRMLKPRRSHKHKLQRRTGSLGCSPTSRCLVIAFICLSSLPFASALRSCPVLVNQSVIASALSLLLLFFFNFLFISFLFPIYFLFNNFLFPIYLFLIPVLPFCSPGPCCTHCSQALSPWSLHGHDTVSGVTYMVEVCALHDGTGTFHRQGTPPVSTSYLTSTRMSLPSCPPCRKGTYLGWLGYPPSSIKPSRPPATLRPTW